MGTNTVFNPLGGNTPLVDKMIGSAYHVVKAVAQHINEVDFVAHNLTDIVRAASLQSDLRQYIDAQDAVVLADAEIARAAALSAEAAAAQALADAGTARTDAATALAAAAEALNHTTDPGITNSLRTDLTAVQGTVSTHTTKITALEARPVGTDSSAAVSALQSAQSGILTVQGQHTTQIAALQTADGAAATATSQVQASVTTLSGRVDQNTAGISTNTAGIAAANTAIAANGANITANAAAIAAANTARAALSADVLHLAGGTLTGPLILSHAPATALEAATKAYVDAFNTAIQTQIATINTTIGTLNPAPPTVPSVPTTVSTITTNVKDDTGYSYTVNGSVISINYARSVTNNGFTETSRYFASPSFPRYWISEPRTVPTAGQAWTVTAQFDTSTLNGAEIEFYIVGTSTNSMQAGAGVQIVYAFNSVTDPTNAKIYANVVYPAAAGTAWTLKPVTPSSGTYTAGGTQNWVMGGLASVLVAKPNTIYFRISWTPGTSGGPGTYKFQYCSDGAVWQNLSNVTDNFPLVAATTPMSSSTGDMAQYEFGINSYGASLDSATGNVQTKLLQLFQTTP